jgi:hypothetical protein
MTVRWKRLAWSVATLVALGLLALALRPAPIDVDVASAERGPMQVTVDEEARRARTTASWCPRRSRVASRASSCTRATAWSATRS